MTQLLHGGREEAELKTWEGRFTTSLRQPDILHDRDLIGFVNPRSNLKSKGLGFATQDHSWFAFFGELKKPLIRRQSSPHDSLCQ